MRLENKDAALVVKLLHGVKQHLQFARMVGIVVIHIRAVELALELKAASRAVEARKPVLHGVGSDAEADGRGGCGERVFHVVHTGDVKHDIGKEFPLIHDVKL